MLDHNGQEELDLNRNAYQHGIVNYQCVQCNGTGLIDAPTPPPCTRCTCPACTDNYETFMRHMLSSRGDRRPQTIEAGVHALSNASLDTPWPKVERAKDAMRDAMQGAIDLDDLCAKLFALLADQEIARDDTLPRTGVALDVERALSAAFIRMQDYGTRSSTLYVVDREGNALFIERRCEPELPIEERRFDFRIAVV